GTLYGATSMGGLIKYVSTPPNLTELQIKGEASYEGVTSHGTGNAERVLVNLPLINDVLAIRTDAFRIEYPGSIDNVFRNEGDANTGLSEGGRASLLWKPIDAFSVRLTSSYQRITSENPPTMDVQPLTLQPTSGDLKSATPLQQPLYSKWFVNNLTLSY